MRIAIVALMGLLVASTGYAQIPLDEVRIVGSPPVFHFRQTCTLDQIGIVQGRLSLRTRGAMAAWPAVSIEPGDPGSQAATLWVFLRVNGAWHATGAERLRPTQVNGDKPQGSPADLIGSGWLYDPNRWGPMSGHNPVPGEHVGFLVVAGSTRSDNKTPVQERCDVVEVVWPGPQGGDPLPIVWREGTPAPPPAPPPYVPPTAPPVLPNPAPALADLGPRLDRLQADITALTTSVGALSQQLAGMSAAQQAQTQTLLQQLEARALVTPLAPPATPTAPPPLQVAQTHNQGWYWAEIAKAAVGIATAVGVLMR